jgi:hypothetical protein
MSETKSISDRGQQDGEEEFVEEEIFDEEIEEYEESVTIEEEEILTDDEEMVEETVRDDSAEDHLTPSAQSDARRWNHDNNHEHELGHAQYAVCLNVTEETEQQVTARLYHALHMAMNTLEHRETEIYAKPPTSLLPPQDNKKNTAITQDSLTKDNPKECTSGDTPENSGDYAVCLHVTNDNEEEVSSRLYGATQHALDAFARHELELLMARPNPIPVLPMPMEPKEPTMDLYSKEDKVLTPDAPRTEIVDAESLMDGSSSSMDVSATDGLLSAVRQSILFIYCPPVAKALGMFHDELISSSTAVKPNSTIDHLSPPLTAGLLCPPPADQSALSDVHSTTATHLHSNLHSRAQEYSRSEDNPSDEDEEILQWTPSPKGPSMDQNELGMQQASTNAVTKSETSTQKDASPLRFLAPLSDEVEAGQKDYQYSRLDAKPRPEQWCDEPLDVEAAVPWDTELPRTLERAGTIYESDFMIPPRWYKSEYEAEKVTGGDSIQVGLLRLVLALMVGVPIGVGTYFALS